MDARTDEEFRTDCLADAATMLQEVADLSPRGEAREQLRRLLETQDCSLLEKRFEVRAFTEQVRQFHERVCCGGWCVPDEVEEYSTVHT
ncbi:MAG: hypothetical protein PHO20_05910 [Candidatus Peribacteraceae bacterium]|nr:hypothetical protein [Candidatus Peribacteraceae bacterium]MDD5740271.1 hypothetical protein [Candidatus Peribacteraceae bacterium]